MSKKLKALPERIGFGYVGMLPDHNRLFCLPDFLFPDLRNSCGSSAWKRFGKPGSRRFLCKITVELVRDTLGRPITRVKKKNDMAWLVT